MEDLDRRFLLGGLAGVAGISALAAMSKAGPLSPPAGPVAATGKTLGEVEPRTPINAATTPPNAGAQFVITQPGSYYLTGNLTGQSGKSLISVYADNVTIDLNGFALVGVAGATQAVVCNVTSNLTLKNGVVTGWPAATLNMGLNGDHTLRNVRFHNCTGGCYLGDRALVEGCVFTGAFNDGVNVGAGSVVRNCVLNGAPSAAGYPGISLNAGSATLGGGPFGGLVEGCLVTGFGHGIRATSGTVRGCTVRSCTIGIFCAGTVLAEGNTVDNNGTGIRVNERCRIVNNHVTSSTDTGSNAGGLFVVGQGNLIEGNTLVGNATNLRITPASTFNLVIRNRMAFAGAGGNLVFTGANSIGTLVNAGSGGSPASTDSNANILF